MPLFREMGQSCIHLTSRGMQCSVLKYLCLLKKIAFPWGRLRWCFYTYYQALEPGSMLYKVTADCRSIVVQFFCFTPPR